MARLRYNNIGDPFATSNPITLSSGVTTTASWTSSPGFPTIAAPDIAVVIVEPNTANEEIIYITAYTSAATTATVTRGQEGTSAVTHSAKGWVHGPTVQDYGVGDDVIWQAKGDLAAASAASTAARFVVGTDNFALVADSSQTLGLNYKYVYSLPQQINAQVATTYTLVLTDTGKVVTLSNASPITLTVPPNSSVAFPIGTSITLLQLSAGQATVAPGSGVTISSSASLSLRAPSSGASLIKTGTDTWYLTGDLLPLGETINAQTGTTYTTVLTDVNELVTLNNVAAITLTVPPNSSVNYPIGARIDMAQIGAGQVTVVGGAGVTVNGTPGLKFRAQYSSVSLIQTLLNTWLLVGDLST